VGEAAILRSARAGFLVSRSRIEEAHAETLRIAEEFFRKNPRKLFLDKLQLRRTLGAEEHFFEDLLAVLEREGVLAAEAGGRLRFRDYGPRLDPEDERVRKVVIEAVEGALFAPPSPQEIAAKAGLSLPRVEEILHLLDEEGEVLKLAEGIHLHKNALAEARRRIGGRIEAQGPLTAADARDVIGSSRKFVIPILEELDREGFTVRKGDFRDLKRPTATT
jgi:selenocysteine-specific elongation factor